MYTITRCFQQHTRLRLWRVERVAPAHSKLIKPRSNASCRTTPSPVITHQDALHNAPQPLPDGRRGPHVTSHAQGVVRWSISRSLE